MLTLSVNPNEAQALRVVLSCSLLFMHCHVCDKEFMLFYMPLQPEVSQSIVKHQFVNCAFICLVAELQVLCML